MKDNLREPESAFQAMKTIDSDLAYVSHPISSGKRLFELTEDFELDHVSQLKSQFAYDYRELVLKPNMAEGKKFGRKVSSVSDLPVVIPSLFEQNARMDDSRWGEEEFMHFWVNTIRDKIARMHMAPDWEYSNGAVEEFKEAKVKDIPVLDHNFDGLSLDQAREMIWRAIRTFQGLGTDRLEELLAEVEEI